MRRLVVLRLLLTVSAFVAGASGVALMAPEGDMAVRLAAAGLIAFALALVPLAYQPRPSAAASVAASILSIALGLVALTPVAQSLLGDGTAIVTGVLAIASAVGQLLCLREPVDGAARAAA
ncbi:MAG: hypothetical protein ACK50Q_03685 [Labrys sp. (in: a-proteobacteria)]